jgi:hypothetical protein
VDFCEANRTVSGSNRLHGGFAGGGFAPVLAPASGVAPYLHECGDIGDVADVSDPANWWEWSEIVCRDRAPTGAKGHRRTIFETSLVAAGRAW